MPKINFQLFHVCLLCSSTLFMIANAFKGFYQQSHHNSRSTKTKMIKTLFGRDKSPNPASISYSGCQLKGSLSCSSHSDSDIQIGECWSNARVMGQKSAFFVPFQPGHQSYDSEGGPYGICTAYSCFPTENQMQSSSNLANFCFFWDGKDHTIEQNGGLNKRSKKQKEEKSNKKEKVTKNKKLKATNNDSSDETDDGKTSSTTSTTSNSSGNDNDKESVNDQSSSSSGKDSSQNHPKSSNESNSTAGNSGTVSNSNQQQSLPKAPGNVVIPIPMICPSNLKNCYSSSYFEPGGKLEKYSNLKPTYAGIWFPPKNPSNHQPMFCDGLNLGCPTPTMQQLQSQNLANQHCDVSKCKNPNGTS